MAIQFKGSDITGVSPADSELETRELGINTKDGKLFTKTPAGNIIEIGAANINTGLETPTPAGGVHTGHRYINGSDAPNFMPLGADATDLTYSSLGATPTSIGANGAGSFSAGIDSMTTGVDSFALGKSAQAIGDSSYAIGSSSHSNGTSSITIGDSSQTITDESVTIGINSYTNAISSLCLGNNNNLTTEGGVLIGTGLLSGGSVTGSIIIGRYNDTNTNVDNFLTIADGTSSGAKSNLLSLKNNGVLVLEKANNSSDITAAGTSAVVTVGYLTDEIASGSVVTEVNGKDGIVTLVTDDIAPGTDVDRQWISNIEKAQINTNKNNIDTKENIIPSVTADLNKFLRLQTPGNGTQSIYTWASLDASTVSMELSGLTDVSAYNAAIDGRKVLRLPGTVGGPVGGDVTYEALDRSTQEFQLRPIGTSSGLIGQSDGAAFELFDDPYYWGINLAIATKFLDYDDLFVNADVPTSEPEGVNLKTVFVATIPDLAVYGDVVQTYVEDIAANLSYDNTTSLLTATDVNDAIDEVLAETVTNGTDIGNTTLLTTDLKTDTVSAINEVDNNTDTNTSAIGTLTGLTTTDKSSLVSAINEVDANEGATNTIATTNATNIGTLTNLTTSAQDNLVNAINEVDASVGGVSINYRNDSAGATIAPLDYSFADTASAVFTLSLPASAGLSLGNQIIILDSTGSFSTNNLTVSPDLTDTIMGANTDFVLDVDNREYKFIWSGSDWRVI